MGYSPIGSQRVEHNSGTKQLKKDKEVLLPLPDFPFDYKTVVR